LPTQNNPSIIRFFKKLAHPTPKKKKKKSRNFADIIKLQSPQATKRGFRNSSLQADLTRGNIFINLLSVFLLLPLESSDSC